MISGSLLAPIGAEGVIGAMAAVVAVTVAVVLSSHVKVTVGANGLVAGLGPLHMPRVRIPLDEVDDVSVVQVEPMAWGGWGYRMWPGVRAVVVRRGEGIRVSRERDAPTSSSPAMTLPEALAPSWHIATAPAGAEAAYAKLHDSPFSGAASGSSSSSAHAQTVTEEPGRALSTPAPRLPCAALSLCRVPTYPAAWCAQPYGDE